MPRDGDSDSWQKVTLGCMCGQPGGIHAVSHKSGPYRKFTGNIYKMVHLKKSISQTQGLLPSSGAVLSGEQGDRWSTFGHRLWELQHLKPLKFHLLKREEVERESDTPVLGSHSGHTYGCLQHQTPDRGVAHT